MVSARDDAEVRRRALRREVNDLPVDEDAQMPPEDGDVERHRSSVDARFERSARELRQVDDDGLGGEIGLATAGAIECHVVPHVRWEPYY